MAVRFRSAAVATVCLAYGCAGGTTATPGKTPQHPDRAAGTSATSRSEKPAVTARHDAPIDVDPVQTQVRALRQAIVLYGQFIERAEHQPEMKDAVERSKERIEDAQATIDFLLKTPASDPR